MSKFETDDKIIIDLDGTLTVNDAKKGYHEKPFNEDVVRVLKDLQHDYRIAVFTARNMKTFQGDLGKIHEVTKPIAEKWLTDHQIPYDEIIMGKPWCGPEGYYVDDKNLHLDEFVFRFSPELRMKTFDVLISFYNEGSNVRSCYESVKKAERLLNVRNYIFINNGSTDKTLEFLLELQNLDPKVKVIDNPGSRGYGDGYRRAMESSSADYVITNHADGQFDLYTFLYANRRELSGLGRDFDGVFPQRLGRPLYDSLVTLSLRSLLSLFTLSRVPEFNGQPKIIRRDQLPRDLSACPHDFTFDLWLYLSLGNRSLMALPVLQKSRVLGESTWNRGLHSQLKMALSYFRLIFKRKFS